VPLQVAIPERDIREILEIETGPDVTSASDNQMVMRATAPGEFQHLDPVNEHRREHTAHVVIQPALSLSPRQILSKRDGEKAAVFKPVQHHERHHVRVNRVRRFPLCGAQELRGFV
jgi:hypothetical protein